MNFPTIRDVLFAILKYGGMAVGAIALVVIVVAIIASRARSRAYGRLS